MALLRCDFHSPALKMMTTMTVILPDPVSGEGEEKPVPERGWKTLYLLHGLSDDNTAWTRQTSLERYAAPLALAVVMPAVQRSFYTDMARGGAYGTFASRELPEICRSFFRLSADRRDNYVAGLSMGGYGAFRVALGRPEAFGAAASLSGAMDIGRRVREELDPDQDEEFLRELESIFGPLDSFPESRHDLFALARRVAESGEPAPRLYQCCGTEDFLYGHNVRFRDHAESLGLDLTYEEDRGEEHTWGYWDRKIQRVLQWLAPLLED